MDKDARLRRLWDTIQDVPPGSVASYGQIAEIAGIPRGARMTAYALRVAPRDLDLPWHRIIQVSGKSAFDPDSPHFALQRKRLAAEGVVMRNGKVDMNKYRWEPGLDELLWKPSDAWDEH